MIQQSMNNVAIDISKHDLIKHAYAVCMAIEKCGASPELTNAVTLSSSLMQQIANYVADVDNQAKTIAFLKDQLAQLANFNPDWDKLEAATDSLREHMAELTEANKRIDELSSHLRNAHAFIENTEAFGEAAATGILKCGDAEWNIDASKDSLVAAEFRLG